MLEIFGWLNFFGVYRTKINSTVWVKSWECSHHVSGRLKFTYRNSFDLWPCYWSITILYSIKSFVYGDLFPMGWWEQWYKCPRYCITFVFVVVRIFVCCLF